MINIVQIRARTNLDNRNLRLLIHLQWAYQHRITLQKPHISLKRKKKKKSPKTLTKSKPKKERTDLYQLIHSPLKLERAIMPPQLVPPWLHSDHSPDGPHLFFPKIRPFLFLRSALQLLDAKLPAVKLVVLVITVAESKAALPHRARKRAKVSSERKRGGCAHL